MSAWFNAETRDEAVSDANEVLENFRVDTLSHSLPGVRYFRCWNGHNGNSAFHVLCHGKWLHVTGQMYDWVFEGSSALLQSMKHACRDVDYYADRLVAVPRDGFLVFDPGRFTTGLQGLISEADEMGWIDRSEACSRALREWLESPQEETDAKWLGRPLIHYDDDIIARCYTYRYHLYWILRACEWTSRQVYAN